MVLRVFISFGWILFMVSAKESNWSLQEPIDSSEWTPFNGVPAKSKYLFVNTRPVKMHTQIVWGSGHAHRPVAIESRSLSMPHSNFKLLTTPFVYSKGFAKAKSSSKLMSKPIMPAYKLYKVGTGFGSHHINSLPISYSSSINKLAMGINSGLFYGKSAYTLTTTTTPVIPAASMVREHRSTPDDSVPSYSYAYDVADKLSGDSKGLTESREGNFVKGQYTVIDADGYRRIVDYTADPVNGFQAVVRREPIKNVVKQVTMPGKYH